MKNVGVFLIHLEMLSQHARTEGEESHYNLSQGVLCSSTLDSNPVTSEHATNQSSTKVTFGIPNISVATNHSGITLHII